MNKIWLQYLLFCVIYIFFSLSFGTEFSLNELPSKISLENAYEREILVDFWIATSGIYWNQNCGDDINHTGCWNSSDPICTWYGIICNSSRNVISIQLRSNNLSGIIPESFGNLTNLQNFSLTNNNLESIPSSIGNLNNLEYIELIGNILTSIPSTIGNLNKLKSLYVFNNFLIGPIPPSIGNLLQLRFLNLNNNNITGPIPKTFKNLINLEFFDLSKNKLSGSIPEFIGNFTNLKYLYLSNNQLTGPIPESIGNLKKLHLLHLYNNSLSGSIPSSIGNLTNLNQLYLFNNQLSGPIPSSIQNSTNLQEIVLSNNNFTGCAFVGQSFKTIDYSFNSLSCIQFINTSSINTFSISNNLITYVPSLNHLNVEYVIFNFENNLISNIDAFINSLNHYSQTVAIFYFQNNSLIQFPNIYCDIFQVYSYLDLKNNLDMVGYIPFYCVLNQFQFLSIKNNEKMKDSIQSEIKWNFTENSVTQIENYVCYQPYPSQGQQIQLELPVSYFNYSNCNCKLDSFGIPPNYCLDCSQNFNYCSETKTLDNYGKCNGDYFNISSGYYTQLKGNEICFRQCENNICNPNGNCVILINKTNSQFYL